MVDIAHIDNHAVRKFIVECRRRPIPTVTKIAIIADIGTFAGARSGKEDNAFRERFNCAGENRTSIFGLSVVALVKNTSPAVVPDSLYDSSHATEAVLHQAKWLT